jgi:L-histidine N-alpha-methyltransferase
MLERIASRGICESSSAVVCDLTLELPLPDNFPRPRVYLCLGNVLGTFAPVGAVRLLRILRTTMRPRDRIVLDLDAPERTTIRSLPDDQFDVAASRHLGALSLINTTAGAAFDILRFDFRPTFDAENSRVETHLVARKALDVEVPGIGAIRLKKGESIRTSVRCAFDRNRVAAMMAGVGLALREWTTDADRRYVVALATPAV